MNILTTRFNLKYSALEIYVSGCNRNPHCEGCHNPESWDFNKGTDFKEMKTQINNKVINFNEHIDKMWILGGEPLDSPDIYNLIDFLKRYRKEMWLFTSYKLHKVGNIREDFDYIKTGRFKLNKITNTNFQYDIKLASENQNIYKKGLDY